MKAKLARLPSDDTAWAYEVKWDGYRTVLHVDGGVLRVQTASGRDVTDTYGELAGLTDSMHATSAIFDGELVVLDDAGLPRFELMQRHAREVVFQAFDLLHLGGHDTIDLPYEDRRRLLEQVLSPGTNWAIPPYRVGGGQELYDATEAKGLEGIMAKRLGSTYRPYTRTPNWRKIKHRRRVEVVIGGFTVGGGNRSSTFGALLIGRRDGDRLAFAGSVGTGFSQATLAALTPHLRDLQQPDCPFEPEPPLSYRREARWVEPILTAQVELTEFTEDGLARHATFLELG